MKKKRILLFLCIAIFSTFLVGAIYGFPWEIIRAKKGVTEYVEENYQLTPTKIKTNFFLDIGSGATVTTKELPFTFEVSVSRTGEASNDSYLTELVEHHLSEYIYKDIKMFLNDADSVIVSLQTPLTKQSPKGLSVSQIDENPKLVLKELPIEYYCIVSLKDKSYKQQDFLDIADAIYQKYSPTYISFFCDGDFAYEINSKSNG